MRSPEGDTISMKFGRLLRAFAALVGLAAVLVIALQCVWWFQNGFWTPMTPLNLWLWIGFSYSPSKAGKIEHALLWMVDLPLGAVLAALAFGAFWTARRIDR